MTARTHNITLASLFAKYGVEPVPEEGLSTVREVSLLNLAEACSQGEADAFLSAVRFAEGDELGAPGTRLIGGRIDAEPNARYGPYQVRGYGSDPGLYERYWRASDLVLDAVASHTETLVAGSWELQAPKDASDEVIAWCEEQERHFHNIKGGWSRFIEHACSMLIFGFAIFEVCWPKRMTPKDARVLKIAFREPSTVDEWVMNERQDELLAVKFRTTGDAPLHYMLPATGARLQDHKVLLCNLNARGNNFEGVAPMRPALHWLKFKELLAQIAAVAAERYGVPRTFIRSDPAWDGADHMALDEEEVDDVHAVVRAMRAVDAPIIGLPDGVIAETHGAMGTMPDLIGLMNYCDQRILTCFSNEGSLLGLQQAVGSYALGEVKERDTLRSAPFYARKIAQPLDELVRVMADARFGSLPAYPSWQYRMHGMQDNSAWIQDATTAFGAGMSSWPKKAQLAGLEKLGLPPETFDEMEAEEEEQEPPGSDTTEGDATEGAESGGAIQLAERELDVLHDIEAMMDEGEKALADRLDALNRQLRDDFAARVRDSVMPTLAARDALRDAFAPRYRGEVASWADEMAERARDMLLADFGVEVLATRFASSELEVMAANVADEALNRQLGYLTQAQIPREGGDTLRNLPLLEKSTLALIASQAVSTAINQGRHAGADLIINAAGAGDKRLRATRSAQLDRQTCEACARLDGVTAIVGSKRYHRLMPPHRCYGGGRCRCIYFYEEV